MKRLIAPLLILLITAVSARAQISSGTGTGGSGGGGSVAAGTTGQFGVYLGAGNVVTGVTVNGDTTCGVPAGGVMNCQNTAAHLTTPLPPAQGGVGGMAGYNWLRNYGNGSDGAGPASGAVTYLKQYTSWTCTGAITFQNGQPFVVLSQGAVNLNAGCTLSETAGYGGVGDIGGAPGSGGMGTANSAAASGNVFFTGGTLLAGGGGASAGGIGNDGASPSAGVISGIMDFGPADIVPNGPHGGGIGGNGGSSGGIGGKGGNPLIVVAPSITIASGATVNVQGFEGTDSAANTQGGGGGGGGGVIIFATPAGGFTDNGGVYNFGGGPGGNCTTPSINATGGGCTAAGGCGIDAAFTVTALAAGGLSAGSITITNAGSGYQVAPICTVNAGASGLTGSPACHFTLSGNTIGSVVIDTAGSGGTLTTFTTCFRGGQGAPGWYKQVVLQ